MDVHDPFDVLHAEEAFLGDGDGLAGFDSILDLRLKISDWNEKRGNQVAKRVLLTCRPFITFLLNSS